MPHTLLATVAAIALAVAAPSAQAEDKAEKGKSKRVIQLTGVDAVRYFVQNSNWKQAEWYAYPIIWQDLRQPELLHLLAQSLARLNRREEAAAYYRLLLRVAEESPTGESDKFKPHAEKYLKFGDAENQKRAAQYAKEAGGMFPGPEKVSDAWMSQVMADLHCLEDLLFYKAVGMEIDVREQDPLWVHTQDGAMHRSGMKHVKEVDGRKGLLFTVPRGRRGEGAAAPKAGELGRPTRITLPYPGKGAVLRFGMKGFIAPLTVEVSTSGPGGQTLLKRPVPINTWSDVKLEIAGLKENDTITLELVSDQDKRSRAGVWIDYVGFYED